MVIACTSGFNLGTKYGTSKRLRIDFKENFEIQDVENIAKEVLNNNDFEIDYTDIFKSGAIIVTKEASDEQITSFENKLKEKYKSFAESEEHEDTETGETHTHEADVIVVTDVPAVNLYDVVKIYIKPVAITGVSSIIILAIVFRKLGVVKALGIPTALIIGINLLYVSILAILRVPISNYAISIGMLIYGLSLIIAVIYTKTKCKNAN